MQSHIAKPPARSSSYTKFSTPLVLEPPLHCGLPTILLGLGKHLIGTDNRCTVRVRADNVEPRHAMIVVSEHRTVVKALHPQTWVNEGPVSEMALRPGDRLSLGPLTFRVRAVRADELGDIQAFNAGTFQDDDSFPSDDLMNRNATTEPSWRVGNLSGLAHESPPSIATSPSMFRTAVASVPDALSIEQVQVAVPAQRPIAARGPDAVVLTTSQSVESSVVAPVALASSLEAPKTKANNAFADRSEGTVTDVAATAHKEATLAGVIDPLEPARQGEAGIARVSPTPLQSVPVSSTPALDQRLEEISQKLAELNRPSVERSSTFVETAVRIDPLAAERRHVIEQQEELRRRADELARQTEQIQGRMAHVEEREAETQRLQTQVIHEHEQLRITKDATRRELEAEYARHQMIWQEWDTSYRRTSAELNEQLQSLEQRRSALLADADRANLERSDLQRLQSQLGRDRRELTALRSQLSNDQLALKSLRTEFATERQHHLAAVQERDAQLAQEHLATIAMQSEVLTARQQLERDRAEFMAERVTAASIRERERLELIKRREQLDQDLAQLEADRVELENLHCALETKRADFAAERVAVPARQSTVTADDNDATARERFVDPYADVDLPPFVVGRPREAVAETEGLVHISKLARRASEGFGVLNVQPSLARRASFSRQEQAWKCALVIAGPSTIDSLNRGTNDGGCFPVGLEPVTDDRFVDPYAGVDLPPLELLIETTTVVEGSHELAQCSLDSHHSSEVAADLLSPPRSLSVIADDTQALAANEDVDRECEAIPQVFSSPGWELPIDESMNSDLPVSDVPQAGFTQESVRQDYDLQDGTFQDRKRCGDVHNDHAVTEGLEREDVGEDHEHTLGASLRSPESTAGESSSLPSGSETRSHRFWEDDSVYDTSPSATAIPAFNLSSLERMSDQEFALRRTAPLTVAAALNVDPSLTNGEAEEGDARGDSVEVWCRSFETPDAEPAFDVEAAAERDSFDLNGTAVAMLDESLSIDETLAEVNRVFGVPLPATAKVESEPSGNNVAEAEVNTAATVIATSSHMDEELTDIEIPVVDFTVLESAFAESCFIKPAAEQFIIPEVTDETPEPEIGSACGASELPAWWKECESAEIPVYEGPRYEDGIAREATEGLIAAPENDVEPLRPEPEAAASSDPLASLRAQLAQMFDMKTESSSNPHADLAEETSSESEPADDIPAEEMSTNDETVNETADSAGSTTDVSTSIEETQPAQVSHETVSSESSSPEKAASSENVESEEDDSVENYMARLLSRARGGATVSPQEAKSLAVSATRASAASADPSGDVAAEEVPFDPADRSHLEAEPKHKQDRQAVRDHLQSFRQVAHQSARSALARHTTKHLLSTLIAKTFLLGVSTAAAAFYLGGPLVGWPAELWNVAACSLATLLSAMEFYRSWSKFQQSRTHGMSPKQNTPPRVPVVAVSEAD